MEDFGVVEEIRPGVFGTCLPGFHCQLLPRVLRPVPDSWVWLVSYRPTVALRWSELPLPLAEGLPAEPMLARLPEFDLLMPLDDFLERLPRMHAWAGMTALQMGRRVPDTLYLARLAEKARDAVLRGNGWLLTCHLPHDGETALLESPDREWLEQVTANQGLLGETPG